MRPPVTPALVAAVLIPAAWTAWRLRRRHLAVTVVGRSMEPTFAAGDVLLARRRIGEVTAGDVVVVAVGPAAGAPSMIVKRVAATAGDPVPRQAVPVPTDASPTEASPTGVPPTDASPTVVPAGKLVLLGDNPASTDSRHFGYVDASRVVAVVARRVRGGRP